MTVTAAAGPDGFDVTAARDRLDQLDQRIAELVQARAALSRTIQDARVNAGGRRIEHQRELAVIAHYTDVLGAAGTALALLLLDLSRGPLPDRPTCAPG